MDRPEAILEPLPYHLELTDYLKSKERELAASAQQANRRRKRLPMNRRRGGKLMGSLLRK